MRRREFIALGGAAVWPRAAHAREPGRIYNIGWLTATTGPPPEFREALRRFGWIEGQTVAFASRQAEGRREQLPDMAADLVRSNVDVIAAEAPSAIRAAMQATATIPIVMAFWGGPDPVQAGIIASYARPGGNVTGVQMQLYALEAKRLDLLHQAVPGARKTALLVPDVEPHEVQLPPIRHVARERGIELQVVGVKEEGGLEGAFDAIARLGSQALLVMGAPDFRRDRKLIIELAARKRVPAMLFSNDSPRDGALIGYSSTREELHRMTASYIDRILKGARPADLPVEQPSKFELAINLKTARELGLTIPPTLLAYADDVIE